VHDLGWLVAAQVDAGGGQRAFRLLPAPDRLELLLPCVLFGVRSRYEPLMAEVALNLDFAPRLHAAAKRITGGRPRCTCQRTTCTVYTALKA
jgi:hypothetical protein